MSTNALHRLLNFVDDRFYEKFQRQASIYLSEENFGYSLLSEYVYLYFHYHRDNR